MNIREATPDDVDQLARLSGQLGYAASATELGERLGECQSQPAAHAIFVATGPGGLTGWLHVGRRVCLETRPRAEILGLVVDGAAQRAGIGRSLVRAGEAWARAQGLTEMIVRSNVARALSHPFYERVGYCRTKTQHVYVRVIA